MVIELYCPFEADGGFSRQFQGQHSRINGILAEYAIKMAGNANAVSVAIPTLSPSLSDGEVSVSQNQLELELAWEEVTFWQDFVVWWKAEHQNLPEPRVMEALEKAWMRYERALELGPRPRLMYESTL